MRYKGEIEYVWGIGPEELERKIQDGWALISISPYASNKPGTIEAHGMVAVLRRPIPEEKERMAVAGITA